MSDFLLSHKYVALLVRPPGCRVPAPERLEFFPSEPFMFFC